MSSLKQIQQQFIDFVYKKESVDPKVFIQSGKALDSRESLSVYRNSVFGNLTNALGDIYPALKQCLGERFFNAMAQRYIEIYPSRSPSLDDYGEHLSEFITTFAPLADYAYCVDLANLEWHWHRAFHSADQNPLDLSKLVDIAADENEEEICLRLIDSAFLLRSAFPVLNIWQMSVDEIEGNVSTSGDIDLEAGEQLLMIWRSADYDMNIELLSELQFDVLQKIKNVESLGTILTTLESKYAPEEINQVFTQAMQYGWLANP